VVVLAGPNGAGKSTLAPTLLRDTLGLMEFVNADVIASGLSAFAPESAALSAGRIMLARLRELAASHVSFAFETTLASRSFAPWLSRLESDSYAIHLLFLWLPTADVAVQRVALRVQAGGHAVPEDVIRRRYAAGLRNFAQLYMPIAHNWRVYDNSVAGLPRLIASGRKEHPSIIADSEVWKEIYDHSHGGPAGD
jgi:predicted ABC-type ATPase